MHGHGTRQLSPPRSLTTVEREILRKLVAEISGSVEVLDCQTRHVKVIEECSVGCGTVALAVDEEACPSLDNQGGAPSSGLGATSTDHRSRCYRISRTGICGQLLSQQGRHPRFVSALRRGSKTVRYGLLRCLSWRSAGDAL